MEPVKHSVFSLSSIIDKTAIIASFHYLEKNCVEVQDCSRDVPIPNLDPEKHYRVSGGTFREGQSR